MQGAQILAAISYKFLGCLNDYGLLKASDRETVLSRNAKIICDLGDRDKYCTSDSTPVLKPGSIDCHGKYG